MNGVDSPAAPAVSPLRRQYLEVKARHPDAIVLFRLGDFYETFDEDARTAAAELDIVLTGRDMGKGQRVPMAGVPAHSLEGYLARLIRRGYKVAICEQVSEPVAGGGLVDRDVVRVVTPGTVVEPGLLDERANNFIAAVALQGDLAGIAYADITTAEFATAQVPLLTLPLELERLGPAELLVPEELDAESILESLKRPQGDDGDPAVTPIADALFRLATARRTLLEHFGVTSLEAYGCEGMPLAVRAAGALLAYLQDTQKGNVGQITALRTYSPERYMVLDYQTRRNLELFRAGRFGGGTALLDVLDYTKTPMGGRLLRRWLGQPLLDRDELERRLDAVAWFHASSIRRENTAALLGGMSDLERLVNRVTAGNATPREVVSLRRSLEAVPAMVDLLAEGDAAIGWLRGDMHPCEDVVAVIAQAVNDDAASMGGHGGVVRPGFSSELDSLRTASRDAKEYIAGLERQERERSGIGSLKVGYNKVFGYYLEVSNSNLARVPEEYIRRQTLVNAERYITPELKEFEALILNAEERLEELESAIFRQVCRQVANEASRILQTASAVAQVDLFRGLAEAASRNGYVRPEFAEDGVLEIAARPAPGGGARCRRGGLRAQRHRARAGGGVADGADGAQHGGQVDVHPSGRAHRADGAGWQLCAGRTRRGWASSTASSPASACRTTWRRGSRRSWSRWWRRRPSCTTRLRSRLLCWTRSAGARAPTTGWPSPERWRSTCTATLDWAARRSSRRTTTS